ncbi:flavin monoamine oxidase family protein [Yoonia sediminilitoris]|uniref:Tryptophan 2-monooxygenase n=1 Tax=Yoonia sediminilitoris TaxID=1286148 RepID=A0A2T6KMT1_9RHOB|nr:FAD-dependent oxidoreductase [Yoonia sediminilitoris]PUB17516.1 monoamine oxidase [Yoonia sediminilitoris]RCW97811.1 monoamine oxidase [Yoonia sediminilitoris]
MTDLIDFAIVGGGASGIYTAWRLAQATDTELDCIRKKIGGAGPLKIAVYESSDRIGGRLLSASPASMPDDPMEIGGMRFLNNQPIVSALVEKLDIAHHQQVVAAPNNYAWLRRKHFVQSELVNPDTDLPYNLTDEELAFITNGTTQDPSELLSWAVTKEFPEIKGLQGKALKEFLHKAKVDGRPLYQVGFWNLLSRHLSHEGRKLAITAIGYDVLGANSNAVDIIAENFDFTPGTKYYLFDEGFEAMLWELAGQFEESGRIHMGMRLDHFDDYDMGDGHKGMCLHFEKADDVHARAIVLALPQAAIKALRRTGPLLDPDRAPQVPALLESVEGIPLYKLFLIYESPWWKELCNLSEGRSVTDIPLRQCYYWSTNDGSYSAIMAYNDQSSTSFWGGYQTGPEGPRNTRQLGHGPAYFESEHADWAAPKDHVAARRHKNWTDHKVPKEMVLEMHRQLMEMHQVTDAPEPVDAAYMDWMNAPYGGAVHFWNPGYKSWELVDKIPQPVDGLNAFIVGESFSTVQTWVEGALQTSDKALAKLGMGKPDWQAKA